MNRPITEAIETFVAALQKTGCNVDDMQLVLPLPVLSKLFEEHKGQFKKVFFSNQDDKSFMRTQHGALMLQGPN